MVEPNLIKLSQETSLVTGKTGEGAAATAEPVKNDSEASNAENERDKKDTEDEFMKKDVQLQKAIELLKTWKVFKELRSLQQENAGA